MWSLNCRKVTQLTQLIFWDTYIQGAWTDEKRVSLTVPTWPCAKEESFGVQRELCIVHLMCQFTTSGHLWASSCLWHQSELLDVDAERCDALPWNAVDWLHLPWQFFCLTLPIMTSLILFLSFSSPGHLWPYWIPIRVRRVFSLKILSRETTFRQILCGRAQQLSATGLFWAQQINALFAEKQEESLHWQRRGEALTNLSDHIISRMHHARHCLWKNSLTLSASPSCWWWAGNSAYQRLHSFPIWAVVPLGQMYLAVGWCHCMIYHKADSHLTLLLCTVSFLLVQFAMKLQLYCFFH